MGERWGGVSGGGLRVGRFESGMRQRERDVLHLPEQKSEVRDDDGRSEAVVNDLREFIFATYREFLTTQGLVVKIGERQR